MRKAMLAWSVLVAALAALLPVPRAEAAGPYTPPSDDTVVERLPQQLLDADARRQARRQWQQLSQAEGPAALGAALAAARDALQRSRWLGDPRELGHAQAALAPWWGQASPPPEARLLRATILQSRHEFAAALADLDALVAGDAAVPQALRLQALLTRAAVYQVQGRTRDAQQDCRRLAAEPAAALPAQVCLAELATLQGRPEGLATLRVLALQTEGTPQAPWVGLVWAEAAAREGRPEAEAAFRQALGAPAAGEVPARAIRQAEVYPLAAYADWLIARGRPAEAARLLQTRQGADALDLRLAIAWRRLGDPRAAALSASLAERFEATRRRGEAPHEREAALHALHLRGDAAGALALAQRNWQAQKEPADARLLQAAALAAGRPEAAVAVQQVAQREGWQGTWLAMPAARTAGERA